MNNNFAIANAQVVLAQGIFPRSCIVVKGKRIAAVLKNSLGPRGIPTINARGNFIAPGFIDLHIHGEIQEVSRQQARGGTTGFLATLHPAAHKVILKNIARALAQRRKLTGAQALGIRLEGPFLNREFSGALPKAALRKPNLKQAREIISQAGSALKMVVLAPELPGAGSLIRLLKRYRVIASLGHTNATYEQALGGINAGIRHATHVFNRMRAFDQRNPAALGAVLTDERVSCEVIADGIHVHPAALQLLFKCKGLDNICLVTDSTAAQELPLKRRAGAVFRLKNGTLYGTALTLNKALKNVIKFLGLSLPEAVRLVTLNPARLLRMESTKGSLAVGKDADLVIFDRNFQVKMTMVEGNVRYSRLHR